MSKIGDVFKATWHVMMGRDKKKDPAPASVEETMSSEEIADYYMNKTISKEEATAAGEPWVDVLGLTVDYKRLDLGSFEIDFNDQFVELLVRAGYGEMGSEPHETVDRWFTNVCRNIVLETYQQALADPTQSRKMENGRREYK